MGLSISLRSVGLAVVGLVLCLASYASAAEMTVHREVLPNGLVLQVVHRPAPALAIVTVEMAFKAGAVNDPKGKAGTANLVSSLLTEGTDRRSAAEIAEAIEFVGGSLGASVDRDYASVGLSVLSRDLPMGLEVLAEVVRQPAFAADEFARVRAETRSALHADEDSPGRVAAKAFDAALFAEHPYGRPLEGDLSSLDAIDRADLLAFHQKYYTPGNGILSLVGDVTPSEAKRLVLAVLGDWRGRSPDIAKVVPAVAPSQSRLITIDRPVAQANVVLGHLGVRRDDPDFYPLVVMNYVLGGGGFTSRVVKSVRDDQGLVYSIRTGFHARQQPGTFSVVFQTQNGNANQAIKSVLAELQKIRTEPVTEQELSEAQSYLSGSFPLRLDTNRKTAHLLTFIEVYGLGLDYFDDYVTRIRAVTRDDILRVAKAYLHPGKMIWVVVANQQEAAVVAP